MSRSESLAAGVIDFRPEELTARVHAGTEMPALRDALAEAGQRLRLPMIGRVGGTVAARRNGLFPADNRGLPHVVMMLVAVDGEGRSFRAGGPTVKNVSGFDLVKILVGSWGTLATITEVTFRTEPIPKASRWFEGRELVRSPYRPSLICRREDHILVNIEGHPVDVEDQRRLLGDFVEIDPPSETFLAGDVSPSVDPSTRQIWRRLKASFDPTNRLAPDLSRRIGLFP